MAQMQIQLHGKQQQQQQQLKIQIRTQTDTDTQLKIRTCNSQRGGTDCDNYNEKQRKTMRNPTRKLDWSCLRYARAATTIIETLTADMKYSITI